MVIDHSDFETPSDREIAEYIAPFFHNLWWEWSIAIAQEEEISEERIERWRGYWKPYQMLSHEDRESDIERAEAFVEFMENLE